MAPRLSSEFVKSVFNDYGYLLPKDFRYGSNSDHIPGVYDTRTNQYISPMTYKILRRQIDVKGLDRMPTGDRVHPKDTQAVLKLDSKVLTTKSQASKMLAEPVIRTVKPSRNSLKAVEPSYLTPEDMVQLGFKTPVKKPVTKLDKYKTSKSYEKGLENTVFKFDQALSKFQDTVVEFSKDQVVEIDALKQFIKNNAVRLNKTDVRLTITDAQGLETFETLNPNTIAVLTDIQNDVQREVYDSDSTFIFNRIDSIKFEFIPRATGRRITGGFYAYKNVSELDLTRYGIFSSVDADGINDPCLYHCFKEAMIAPGVPLLDENELGTLKAMLRTRSTPRTALQKISDMFSVRIIYKLYYRSESPGKPDSISAYVCLPGHKGDNIHKSDEAKLKVSYKYSRTITIGLRDNHYFLNEQVNLPGSNMDSWWITRVQTVMIREGLLVPWTEDEAAVLEWGYEHSNEVTYDCKRPIVIPDKSSRPFRKVVAHSQFLFGYASGSAGSSTAYASNPQEEQERLDELQAMICELGLKIDVRKYYRYSELMQKIMYEYGCFENVFEYSGKYADSVRNSLVFPRTRTHDDKPLYSSEKLFYIDLNGAYSSCIDSIDDNEKIGKLIRTLYDIRLKAKANGQVGLATTIKFLMNSCWGSSIRRPKIIKNKYTNNVEKYVNTFAPFVSSVSGNYVKTVEPLYLHYTYPQFAKRVLDNYNEMFNKIKGLVHVYYENIDAILINESDYNKLNDLGYIGTGLGQFKIEHIFTEIAILSPRKYVATLESCEKVLHLVKQPYKTFVERVKAAI